MIRRKAGLQKRQRRILRDAILYYVYLLQSERDHGWYIGYTTSSPEYRLSQHNSGSTPSTRSRQPFRLIYYEAYTDRADAEGRERFLKSGSGRRFLKKQLRYYLEKSIPIGSEV